MKLKNLQRISKHAVAKCARLLAGAGVLLFAASNTAHADIYSAPGVVDAIEQTKSTFFSGVTFVHMQNARCVGRADGYFLFPSDSKQPLQLELVLSSISSGRAVTINHNPSTCIASSVGLCRTNPGIC